MGGGGRGEECRWGEGEGERNVHLQSCSRVFIPASYNYIAKLPWKLSTFQVCMELCEFCILVSSVCVDGSLNKTTPVSSPPKLSILVAQLVEHQPI